MTGHPRVCGERLSSALWPILKHGSSPRVRGTRYISAPIIGRVRVIPACAGNARRQLGTCSLRAGHPRVCGERILRAESTAVPYGSSPRVRGTPRRHDRVHRQQRVIPACAGNAPKRHIHSGPDTGHPRVCGERGLRGLYSLPSAGSSPRVRGTRPPRPLQSPKCRVIPACAGNATLAATRASISSGHPRVCGERQYAKIFSVSGVGSSPRVRGTLPKRVTLITNYRVIPACAGNAWKQAWTTKYLAGHPRVCGERLQVHSVIRCLHGSSPRVRGTLCSQ